MEITIKINIDDAVGKVTVESTEVSTAKITEKKTHSQYARFFDESSPYWSKDPEYYHMFLMRQGYLFLNDVYDSLGLP